MMASVQNINKKVSYSLENRASAARILFHRNSGLKNWNFSENLLSNGYTQTHPQLLGVKESSNMHKH